MNATLFDSERMQMTDSIKLTIESLRAHASTYDVWVFAWSGGKDSTTCLTLILYLIESGKIPRPKILIVLYADTRQEILPLWHCANEIKSELEHRGVDCKTVFPPLDKRMWVYILGRGVPPPNNNTLRYCTRQIKIEPMAAEVKKLAEDHGQKVLVLTGVRLGESAARDSRIQLACSTNGAECGQGYFQQTLEGAFADTLAPIVHWRVCHVWEWLKHWAPLAEFGDWSTSLLADAYGGDEAQEINARTGCVCCPLASKDSALDAIIRLPRWSYLANLKNIRDLYEDLRRPENRLRKPGGERRQDGTLCSNQQRLGPLTIGARLDGLKRLVAIQSEVNSAAVFEKRPLVDHLNKEEHDRIYQLIHANTWPDGWSGEEPTGDVDLPKFYADGSVQNLLFEDEGAGRHAQS